MAVVTQFNKFCYIFYPNYYFGISIFCAGGQEHHEEKTARAEILFWNFNFEEIMYL